MTSAIKSMNWVLLQTAAWKYSAYFLCYSVLPECWLHTQVRLHQLLIFAVCFPGTWLVGGVHLGRLCRFLEFSNLICFSGMEDTGSGFSIFPHFSSLFFFLQIASFLFILCLYFVWGLVNPFLFSEFRAHRSFLLLTERQATGLKLWCELATLISSVWMPLHHSCGTETLYCSHAEWSVQKCR